MIDPSKNVRDLMNACVAMSAATSAAIGNVEHGYRPTKDRDYGDGIILTNIPTLQRRSKAHNRKTNRRK